MWLAALYANGEGVEVDYTEAAHWLNEAAELGDKDAELWLERLYEAVPSTKK